MAFVEDEFEKMVDSGMCAAFVAHAETAAKSVRAAKGRHV